LLSDAFNPTQTTKSRLLANLDISDQNTFKNGFRQGESKMNISSKLMMMMAVLTTATVTFGQDPYDSYRDNYGTRSGRLSQNSSDDFPVLPERLSDYSRAGSVRRPLERTMPTDPFRVRRPVLMDNSSGSLDGRDDFVREEADLGSSLPVRSNRNDGRLTGRGSVGAGSRSNRDYGFDEPVNDTPYRRESPRYDLDRLDPFVPAPLPRGQGGEETLKIDELLTIRYSNPVNVRAIRAMTSQQAVQLYSEVSQKIDERSLEPTSYDVRVRRALRNLQMALDNPAFMNGLQVSADSFQTDAFRDVLGRLAETQQVGNYQEARAVLNQVMQASQNVRGLTPSVVAFEFANASIDTLDKFSGLEAADPSTRNGAELQGQKTAALDEEIVGVGVEVKEHADGLLVLKALRGGPAAEAGIQSGDVIISIDGRSLSGMKMLNSVDLMKGTSGSPMTVRIYREGKGERNFNLTRRKVRVWTVNDTRILEGNKERIQKFSGVVIARRGSGTREMFTVRRIVQGEGVERSFPVNSPKIAHIEITRHARVRRAKLFYLRDRAGKATRLRERNAKPWEVKVGESK